MISLMKDLLKEALISVDPLFQGRKEKFVHEFHGQLQLVDFKANTEVICDIGKMKTSFYRIVLIDPLTIKIYFQIRKKITSISAKKNLAKLSAYCTGKSAFSLGVMLLLNPTNKSISEIADSVDILTQFPKVEIWIIRDSEIEVFMGYPPDQPRL
jgi:hypothetical protein